MLRSRSSIPTTSIPDDGGADSQPQKDAVASGSPGRLGACPGASSDFEARDSALSAAAAELVPQLSGEELNALKKAARKDLTARVEAFAAQMGVSYGRISIRHQKSKWGSCSSSGNLNLNCLLMLTPEFVRDYVVVHELSHRRHMNHSPAFWAEVARILPDYKSARAWLRENGTAVMDRNPVP